MNAMPHKKDSALSTDGTNRDRFNGMGYFGSGPLVVLVVCILTALPACRKQNEDAPPGSPGPTASPDAAWLVDITSKSGLVFSYETGATGSKFMPEIMGGGAALFDFDGDGDLDIYLVNGKRNALKSADGHKAVNHLFRQDPGGAFVDVTQRSGLGDGGFGMGVALGDIDNDGLLDVYVTNYGRDALYLNRGDGRFENITERAGVIVDRWSCSATFFDYNLDGFLDLFVTQYFDYDPLVPCYSNAGVLGYCTPKAGPPLSDRLFRNNGNGTFTDVSDASGIASARGAGLGVVSDDFNNDGWPDLYVANDAYDNHLWINQGDGTFQNDGLIMGLAYNMHGAVEAGMGVVAADFDNDMNIDIFLTHLLGETNTLYRNLGGSIGFTDATGQSGLGAASLPHTGFGIGAFDLELDGDLDILVANGRVILGPIDSGKLRSPWHRYAEPNAVYINDGQGRFSLGSHEAGAFGGADRGRAEITRGLAVGDIDGDGDLDVLINNIEGPARLYRNDAPRAGHWISVRAFDSLLKRDVIGARVIVTAGARRFTRTVTSTSGYLSANQPIAHFGLGDLSSVDHIDITWPGGERERFGPAPADRPIRLVRGTGKKVP